MFLADIPPEMVRQSTKHRPLGKGQPWAIACPDQEKKVAMGRTHAAEGAYKSNTPSVWLEFPREKETRAPKADLEKECSRRAEDSRPNLGDSQEGRQGPKEVESNCWGPMLH